MKIVDNLQFQGIDSRQVKCCDPSTTNILSGISIESDPEQPMLHFYYLENIKLPSGNHLHQTRKTMWLNAENRDQLVQLLQEINFEK